MPELTHLGPCPTCGQQRHQVAVCQCGDLVTAHLFGTGKKQDQRTRCTRLGCGCTNYQEHESEEL